MSLFVNETTLNNPKPNSYTECPTRNEPKPMSWPEGPTETANIHCEKLPRGLEPFDGCETELVQVLFNDR